MTQQRRFLAGFTLIETIIVVGVFSFAMLIATSVFLLATRSQRQASISQKLQSDIRYTIEGIARDIKFGTIDYDCYAGNDGVSCDPFVSGAVDLSAAKGRTDVLAVIDPDGNRRRYRLFSSTNIVEVCSTTAVTDPITKCDNANGSTNTVKNWQPLTPDGVLVLQLKFYVAPFLNPYAQSNAPLVNPPVSPYLADQQPRVTIIIQTREQFDLLNRLTITSQTTVSSRTYVR